MIQSLTMRIKCPVCEKPIHLVFSKKEVKSMLKAFKTGGVILRLGENHEGHGREGELSGRQGHEGTTRRQNDKKTLKTTAAGDLPQTLRPPDPENGSTKIRKIFIRSFSKELDCVEVVPRPGLRPDLSSYLEGMGYSPSLLSIDG